MLPPCSVVGLYVTSRISDAGYLRVSIQCVGRNSGISKNNVLLSGFFFSKILWASKNFATAHRPSQVLSTHFDGNLLVPINNSSETPLEAKQSVYYRCC